MTEERTRIEHSYYENRAVEERREHRADGTKKSVESLNRDGTLAWKEDYRDDGTKKTTEFYAKGGVTLEEKQYFREDGKTIETKEWYYEDGTSINEKWFYRKEKDSVWRTESYELGRTKPYQVLEFNEKGEYQKKTTQKFLI